MLYLIKKKRHFSSAVDPPRAFQFLGFLFFLRRQRSRVLNPENVELQPPSARISSQKSANPSEITVHMQRRRGRHHRGHQ